MEIELRIKPLINHNKYSYVKLLNPLKKQLLNPLKKTRIKQEQNDLSFQLNKCQHH